MEISYLGDRVSAGGGCEAGVTVRTGCRWTKSMECGKHLYGKKVPLKLKMAVYKSYEAPANMYGSEAWYQKGNEIRI